MSFLGAFTDSFLASIRFWPLMAFVLTLPIVAVRALRGNRLTWPYLVVSYLLVLYVLGLGFFTLYPMPDDPVTYCAKHATQVQLVPFRWIGDLTGPMRLHTVFQAFANLVFFVPVGVFVWVLRRDSFRTVLVAGFGASLLVETAQLTGIFGYYPCSFRLFDVDDLVINTVGALFGYGVARFVGADVDAARFSAPKVARTWPNRLLAGTTDLLLLATATAATQIVAVLVWDTQSQWIFPIALVVWWLLLFVALPRWKRASAGELLVGLKKDAAAR